MVLRLEGESGVSDLAKLAKDKWRSSGLSDADARRLRLKAWSERANDFGAVTQGLRIPYFDARGRQTKFYRDRFLGELPTFMGKPQRYRQPPDTLPEVYMPPLLKRSWADLLGDSKQPLVITEGELKAACATARGFPTLGLGGVDSWRSAKRGIDLVKVLAQAEWKGRQVAIAYDSDAAVNPNVVRASHGLASELKARGAECKIASLPPAKDGSKQGLDDFLVAGGDLGAALEAAVPLEEASPLWALNAEVVFVHDPGLVVVRDRPKGPERGRLLKLRPEQFMNHHFANRRHVVVVDKKPKVVDTAREWMRWPHRFEASRLGYDPGKPQMVDGRFNVWSGLGVEPEKGDVGPFLDLFDFVCDGLSKEHKRWLLQWLAYPLQRLGTKLYTCVALWSPHQGVGKTLVGYLMTDIYGENGHEIKNRDLDSNFNSYLEGRQFIIGDEITGSDSRAFADQLKGLVTQERARVNAKHVPEYTVPDRANWFFTSNHADAFYLDDADRRFFVHGIASPPRPREFYRRVDRWRFEERGPAKLLYHLLRVDLEGFDPKGHAPVTAAKEAMSYDAKSDVARWVADLKHDPASILRLGGIPIEKDLFSPTELLSLYDPGGLRGVRANGLGRELAKAFVRLPKNATSSHGSQNLYAVRNAQRWLKASPQQRAAHWQRDVVGEAAEGRKEKRY